MVYALVAPLVLMGLYRLIVGGGRRVEVVGSGALTVLEETDAPEGTRYDLAVQTGETLHETEARVLEAVSRWPDVLVIGFSESALEEPDARSVIEGVALAAENATAVPVLVGFEEDVPWFASICDVSALRLCIEPGADPAAAIAAGVEEAWQRHRRLEASTQTGR
ncbi:MAG: hypothetical protein ACI9KE_000354 [Polyangiales bacterium]|jgi:hypothetical protein